MREEEENVSDTSDLKAEERRKGDRSRGSRVMGERAEGGDG